MYAIINFVSFGSLRDPVLGLLVPLEIWVELGQEGLGIILVLGRQNPIIELISEDQFILSISLCL